VSEALTASLTPWIGTAYRHINAMRSGVLDFAHVGLYSKNRWNVPSEPTLYLAGDIGVAVAEWGRRFPTTFSDNAMRPAVRDVYRLHLRLDAVLDLRSPDATMELGLSGAPEAFRDVDVARSAATLVRGTSRAQAMIVPSIAFLDDLTRWNLVVYLDKLPDDTTTWITRVERVGPLSWTPS
jgi:RES domain-containing protein